MPCARQMDSESLASPQGGNAKGYTRREVKMSGAFRIWVATFVFTLLRGGTTDPLLANCGSDALLHDTHFGCRLSSASRLDPMTQKRRAATRREKN